MEALPFTTQQPSSSTLAPALVQRLAEVKRLHSCLHFAEEHPDTDPGSWTLESLHLGENVATEFVQEVAEWTVLYAKELVEP